jgi:CRP/FNR family transcriptional regulator
MDSIKKESLYGNHSTYLFHELLKSDVTNDEGRKSFKRGESIFAEGAHSNGLFCVLSGKVKISRIGENGKEQIVRLAGARDVIGYRALIADEVYHSSAIALEDTVVGYVPKKTFFEILQSNQEISMAMMKLLSKDLDRSESKIVDIATKTVRERLAEVLILLKETYGLKIDGKTIDGNISRDELASIVGSATEVIIRQLAKFKEEGLVETHGRSIMILNANGLIQISKMND